MDFDPLALIEKLLGDLQAMLQADWEKVSPYAQRQTKLLAAQAQMIVQSRLAGSLKGEDDLYDFFLEQLKRLAANFARTLAALTVLTLEKIWNKIVGTLWGAINDTLKGAGLVGIILPGVPQP